MPHEFRVQRVPEGQAGLALGTVLPSDALDGAERSSTSARLTGGAGLDGLIPASHAIG